MQRPSPRFRSQQFFLWKICGETFFPNLQRFVWSRHVGAHLDGHQHGGRKQTETSVTEFCYKSVNLSLEELKNVAIIVHSNTRIVQIAEFPEKSHFLNLHPSSLACHVMPRHAKAQKFKRGLSLNQTPIRSENLYEDQFSATLIHHESKISGGSIVLKFEIQ